MKKKIVILCIAIILIILVGMLALSGSKTQKNEKEFILGLDDSYPPLGFRNEENEIVGFDIDLAKAVCEKLDLKLRLQPISWAAKEQELDSGNIDCIWNGFAYNEERAESMTLSDAYLKGEMMFILRNGSNIKKQEGLKGKKIGVQTGSTGALDLEESEFGKSIEIIQYSDYLTAFMDLEAGNIDSVFAGNITANYLIKSKNMNFEVIKSTDISRTNVNVIAFKKGNIELRDKVNEALIELNREGKLKEISAKWFGEDLTCIKEN